MPLTAIDTSVIVAAHLTQHDHHRVAFQAVEKTLEVEERIVLPLPSLVEAYSVLTKMPAPFRLSPSDAFRALKTSLQNVSEIAALSDQDAWPFFADLSRNHFIGRATYDSQIIACAVKAGAKRILTLNSRDFQRLKPDGMQIVNPLEDQIQ